MNDIITYLKPVSFFKGLFGIIVIIFSFFVMFYQNILFGFFMISFGVYLASSEGSQIDLGKQTFRNIWSIFGIHFGKWKAIPKFEYISVFRGRERQRVNSLGASTTFKDEVFLINLFYDRNKHKTFYRTYNKEDAFRVAKHFRLALGIDILDATEREQKWIEDIG